MRITMYNVVVLPFEADVPDTCPNCDADLREHIGMLRKTILVPVDVGCYVSPKGDKLNHTPTWKTRPDEAVLVGFWCAFCSEQIVSVSIEEKTPPCSLHGCNNLGRYTSGFCGIHDIIYNQGKGERRGQSVKTQKASETPG